MRRGLLVAAWLVGCSTNPQDFDVTTTGSGSGGDTGSTSAPGTTTEPGTSTFPGGVTTSPCPDGGCTSGGPETGGSPQEELDCSDGQDEDFDGEADCFDSDCWDDAPCRDRILRVGTFNVREVGPADTPAYDMLERVVSRLDADVLCLQEVGDTEQAVLQQLADNTGYPHVASAAPGGPSAGMIRSACLSRYELTDIAELGSDDLSTDSLASDMARTLLRVRFRAEPLGRWVTLVTAHLKAGVEEPDRFRRMVEFVRLRQALELEEQTFPDNVVIALGDLNEVPDAPTGESWASVPMPVPFSFQLGSDISLPLTYDPFAQLEGLGFEHALARVEDSSFTDTYLPELILLDYVYFNPSDGLVPLVAEAYESCEDDGVDQPPLGDRMPKAGDPLPCGTNGDASDHRPVVIDFYFE